MEAHGFEKERLSYIPLGVDNQKFRPSHKDNLLVNKLKSEVPERLTIFFPHRFCEEKGLRLLLTAYPILCGRLPAEPTIVFAGTGPDLPLVQKAAQEHEHIRSIGFVKTEAEMARWHASCEMGLALSGWETFGLSILEGMASGQCFVGANTGAAAEHIAAAHCGELLPERTPQALADAICKLASKNDRETLRQNARRYAEKFSWDACFTKQQELYMTEHRRGE
jgi:alpha-1,6-mannosyltransferase